MNNDITDTFDDWCNKMFSQHNVLPTKRFQGDLDDRESMIRKNHWQENHSHENPEWDEKFRKLSGEDGKNFFWTSDNKVPDCKKNRKFDWDIKRDKKEHVHWTEDKDIWPHKYMPWEKKH
jgi:hypothetical protein